MLGVLGVLAREEGGRRPLAKAQRRKEKRVMICDQWQVVKNGENTVYKK